MGTAERREREKQEVRSRILEAARELFVRDGYEAVGMRQIAERAEYSPAALYFHFADKKALIQALCAEDFLALARRFQSALEIGDPLQRLALIGRSYAEFGLQYPNHYRLLFMTPHPIPASESAVEKNNPSQDAYAFLLGAVRQAIAAGRLRPELGDAQMVAQTLWAAIHGVVSLHIVKRTDDDWIDWRPPLAAVEFMIDGVMRGLARER